MYDLFDIHNLSFLFPPVFHVVVIHYTCYTVSHRTLAEDTMMQLSMAHGLTGNAAYLKAKVTCLLKKTVETRYKEPPNEL